MPEGTTQTGSSRSGLSQLGVTTPNVKNRTLVRPGLSAVGDPWTCAHIGRPAEEFETA